MKELDIISKNLKDTGDICNLSGKMQDYIGYTLSKVWNSNGYFKCSYNFSSDGVFETFSDCKYVFINENALDKEGAFVQTNIINNKVINHYL